ncbi:MAG: hypothetical protein ACOY46_14405 [Bacillota bacterium]
MNKRLVAVGVIAAGVLLLFFLYPVVKAAISAGPKDFPAFKKEKLKLPVRNESVYLTVMDNNTNPSGIEECRAANAKAMSFKVGDRRYLLNIPEPLPEYRLEKARSFDIDKNGLHENYSLQDGVLKVDSDKKTIWQSPESWWVDDFFLGDANNDGICDLNLLVWKSGSFGSRRPFWVTREDKSIKNHLFIYIPAVGSFKPLWQSSNLDCPNYGSVLEDINGDGKNELVVSEGDYSIPGERRVSVWRWNGWGFSMIPVNPAW